MSSMGVDELADAVLPVGCVEPGAVVAAGRAMAELVRRLNHATRHRAAFGYPSELYQLTASITAAVYGLEQTCDQLAARLDAWALDDRVGHDQADAATARAACTEAAVMLRRAAGSRAGMTEPLERARAYASHLTYRD